MRKFLAACLATSALVISLPAMADSYSFTERPPEQSLVRPGEEPKPQPQPAAKPVPQQVQKPAAVPQAAPTAPQPVPEADNAFYLKPTYVTQEAFNTFKRQVVQVLKDGQQKTEAMSQAQLNFKIKLQQVEPQMASLKQMMMKLSTLLSAQAGGGNIWMRWWFIVLVIWSVVLTVLVIGALLSARKKKVLDMGMDNGGDYDYMSKADSLPSHLSLAQTYITMNDYARARKSLEFVIMHDKGELRKQAVALMKQLPKG